MINPFRDPRPYGAFPIFDCMNCDYRAFRYNLFALGDKAYMGPRNRKKACSRDSCLMDIPENLINTQNLNKSSKEGEEKEAEK